MIPAAIVAALRTPPPSPADFTATRFCPPETKCWFATHFLRFASAGFPRHQFTKRFYNQLMHTHGFTAHYDSVGFWTEYFTDTPSKLEFLREVLAHPCHGDPSHTWSDVERFIIQRLRHSGLLALYAILHRQEQEARERAELARLLAKYQDASVDPGVLRTVLMPIARDQVRQDSPKHAQMAFALDTPAGMAS